MIGKKNRFHGYSSLRAVYQKGATVRNADYSIRYLKNNKRKDYRVAVVVSKKVAKSAVERNRIRRRIYEIVRQLDQPINGPQDIVITIFTSKVAAVDYQELEASLSKLFSKANLNTLS